MKKQAFLSIGALAVACSIGLNEFHELENSDTQIPGIFYSMLESQVFSLSHEEREKLYPLTEEVVKDEKITFKEREQILHKIEEIREQSQVVQKSKEIKEARVF